MHVFIDAIFRHYFNEPGRWQSIEAFISTYSSPRQTTITSRDIFENMVRVLSRNGFLKGWQNIEKSLGKKNWRDVFAIELVFVAL